LPTFLHWFVYTLCQLVFWWALLGWLTFHFMPSLSPWVQWPFHFLAHFVFVELPAELWPWAVNNVVIALIAGVLLILGLSIAFKAQPARMWVIAATVLGLWCYGRSWNNALSNTSSVNTTPVPTLEPTVLPTPIPTQVSSLPKKEKPSAPVTVQNNLASSAWVPDEETQTNLESEFAALPKNSLVEPLSFQPNTGIEGAMAARRLQDLTDPEKYTFFIGHDAQKVTVVYADTTSLNITYQNGLIGLVTGGTSKLDFYWEDVRAVHCCQINISSRPGVSQKIYQCSLVLADAKQPFVAQCASATNFGRLVSALEFWIQASGNKAIAVTGLPYMDQGLLLNNDRVITQVWAKSPADVAGLKCGDHLWSIEKNLPEQTNKEKLLAGLQSLTPGPHALFTVSSAEWEKAKSDLMTKNNMTPNPKRQKVQLLL
jgi:hypothetical protein